MQLLEDKEQGRQTFDKIYSFGMDPCLAWEGPGLGGLYVKTNDNKFRRKSEINLVNRIYGEDGDALILATEPTNKKEERLKKRQQKKQDIRLRKMNLLNLFEKVQLV